MNKHTESILNKPQLKLVILRRIVGMTFLAVFVFFILLMLIKMMQKEENTYTSLLSGLTERNKNMGLIKTIEEQKMTRKIKDTTGEEEQSSKKLMEAISNLENLSQEILNASNEQKIGGSELLTALDLLQEVSFKNKESIVVLDEHINKFTVSTS